MRNIENNQASCFFQLSVERKEREQTIQCLQALIKDNDNLTRCVQNQHKTLNKQQKENEEVKTKLRDLVGKLRNQNVIKQFLSC